MEDFIFYRLRHGAVYLIVTIFFITIFSFHGFSTSLTMQGDIQNDQFLSLEKYQNLSMLQPGDIAFKHPDIFPDYFPTIIDHCLLYVGYNNSTGMYMFIEASMIDNQVQYRFENESELLGCFYGPFARVKHANDTQKQNAIDFAERQLGKQFQGEWINKNYNPEDLINDSLADKWYCSELIWAAYYNCNNPFPKEEPEDGYIYGNGIDLDRNNWNKNFLNITIVSPREILKNRPEVKVYYLDRDVSIRSTILAKIILNIW
jgi:hypothetical protein